MSLVDFKAETSDEQARAAPTALHADGIEELASFLASVFGGERSVWHDWFAHWWALNPARTAATPRGWIIRSARKKIVAFTANIPFRYVIDGKPALCCATGCTAVDPSWRGLGLGKAVGRQFLDQAHGDLLVGADSTPAAFNLWRSLGMQALEADWVKTNARVLADGVACGTALSQKVGLPHILGRAAGHCMALWLDSPVAAGRRSKALSVAAVDTFASSDAGDIAACRASDASIFSFRDVPTLNWLYFGTPYLRRARSVLVARSGARLVGYLAMKRQSQSYYLLECRCRDADPAIARELILAARELARQNRARSIMVRPYTGMIEAAIPRTLSVVTARPLTTYCYQFRTADVSTASWEAAPGDGDVSVN